MNSCLWLFYNVKQTPCELFHRNNFISEDPLGATSVQVKASKPETCHKGGTTGTQLFGEGKKNTFNLGLPANGDPCARLALLAWFPHGKVWGELG